MPHRFLALLAGIRRRHALITPAEFVLCAASMHAPDGAKPSYQVTRSERVAY